jgi:hypothetical protein
MEKKILVIMVSLVVIAALVVAFVMIASGGMAKAGGFTSTFDKLVNDDESAYNQRLVLPDSWDVGDTKKISDTIVDMSYHEESHGYSTTLWFAYQGDKWNDPTRGSHFYVPDTSSDGWLEVTHGLFSIEIWSATNLSAKYDVGDTITVQTTLKTNVNVDLAFDDEWAVASLL